MHLSPAAYVIQVFGGVRATARAVGRTPSSVSKWAKLGRDGNIPHAIQKVILEVARERELDITAEDIIAGREIESTQSVNES